MMADHYDQPLQGVAKALERLAGQMIVDDGTELERDRYLLEHPFQCEHCKGRYKSQGALTSHVRHHCRVAAEAEFRARQQAQIDET